MGFYQSFWSGEQVNATRYRPFSSWMLFSYLEYFKKHPYNKMKLNSKMNILHSLEQ